MKLMMIIIITIIIMPWACLNYACTQAVEQPGTRLIELPRACHLTYDDASDPRLLALVEQVPDELWGAKLALQVGDSGGGNTL